MIESAGTSSPAGPPSGAGARSGTGGNGSAAVGAWIDAWQPEDPVLLAARQRAGEVGVGAVDPATGAALRMLAAATHATSAVELGTGAGVSSLWLLRGMPPGGILTTVDSESEHQRLAKASFAEAGVPSGRVRVIAGRALDVVPRLSDSAYDVVFCDAARSENLDYLNAAMRLLRPGGVVVFADAMSGGRIVESSARDAETVAMRELARAVRDETRLAPAMLPVSSGLLVAAMLG